MPSKILKNECETVDSRVMLCSFNQIGLFYSSPYEQGECPWAHPRTLNRILWCISQ
jgi:hypothetical protein